MARLDGWESRLHDVIEDARHRHYKLGEHDCFRLACRVVEALTGIDRWPEFAGYTTKRQALQALAYYGHSFVAAGDRFFGVEHQPIRMARRGDVMGYCDLMGEWHLGICIGRNVALLDEAGLAFMDLAVCSCCWRVG